MRENDLMWRGVRASDLGVMVTDPAPRTRPARRVEKESFPGRSGSTVTDLWDVEIYDDITLAPAMVIRPGYSREAVAEWLSGSGRLILGTQPLDAYEARMEDAAEIREMVPGHPDSYAEVTAGFVCSPYRYEAVPMAAIEVLRGGRGVNPRGAVACPHLRIRGDAGARIRLSCSGRTLEAELLAESAEIDCDWEAASGCVTGGDFLRLPPRSAWELGVSVLAGTVESVRMDPRYRSL